MMNFISYWKLDRFRKILGVMKKPEMQETCLVWINDAKISDLHHHQHQQPGLGHLKQVENYMTCLNVILGPHQAGQAAVVQEPPMNGNWENFYLSRFESGKIIV